MDFLPPTFVRDWRQLLRSKGYIILLLLVYASAWVIFLSQDWADIASQMQHAYEPVSCGYGGICASHSEHSDWCYPIHHICSDMENFNRLLLFCAIGAVGLLIPLRVGNAVAADTKVKGTNFLQVTPLSSWGIVGGMWLSAFSQVLVVAALAVPLVLARALVMPTGNEADWYGLLYIVLAGAMFSAAYMFTGGLNNFVRFLLMVPLVILGIVAAGAGAEEDSLLLLHLPWWMHVAYAGGAMLVTLLLLTLARRPYAAPAENNTLPVRGLTLLCMLAACVAAWGVYATGYSYHPGESGLMPAVWVLVLAGVFGAVADAILPVTPLPVHAKHCLRFLPAAVQTPGVLSSALFLLSPLLVFGALCLWDSSSWQYAKMMSAIQHGMPLTWFPLCCVAKALVLWAPLVLGMAVADFFCRRNSGKRPLVVAVSCCALALVMGVASLLVDHEYLPFLNIDMPDAAWRAPWRYWDSEPTGGSAPTHYPLELYVRYAGETTEIAVIAGVEAFLAFLFLALRTRIHRSER